MKIGENSLPVSTELCTETTMALCTKAPDPATTAKHRARVTSPPVLRALQAVDEERRRVRLIRTQWVRTRHKPTLSRLQIKPPTTSRDSRIHPQDHLLSLNNSNSDQGPTATLRPRRTIRILHCLRAEHSNRAEHQPHLPVTPRRTQANHQAPAVVVLHLLALVQPRIRLSIQLSANARPRLSHLP